MQTRPGILTSEFWFAALCLAVIAIRPEVAAEVAALGGVVYGARQWLKRSAEG